MRTAPLVLTASILCLVGAGLSLAQERPARNPFAGDPDAIRNGLGLYRARCADCHGMDGRGVRGPDLTGQLVFDSSDGRLFDVLRRGVPGTEMPRVDPRAPDSEVWQTIVYLRTLSTPVANETPRGNVDNGERIFRTICARCHRVNGRGGALGPDLSRIGAARSRAALVREIRGSSEYLRSGYEPVTLVTNDGERVLGVKKNEETFSIQIMDIGERLQGYLKEDLRELINETQSMMPDYRPAQLSEADLDDLVSYLGSLRGADPPRR